MHDVGRKQGQIAVRKAGDFLQALDGVDGQAMEEHGDLPALQLGLLDVACWDLKSRAAGLPVYVLLGGNSNRVPAYASTVTWDTMDEYERHIKECIDEGFTAFKLHAWGDARVVRDAFRLRRVSVPA